LFSSFNPVNYRKKTDGLCKSEIIRRPQDISFVFETGRFLRGHSFDLIYVTDGGRRVVFAVSKRVRTAVARNRIKRRLREAYRLEKNDFQENVWLILIGHEKALLTPFENLREEIRKMAAKILKF
jgi:ribonuclease P protein component